MQIMCDKLWNQQFKKFLVPYWQNHFIFILKSVDPGLHRTQPDLFNAPMLHFLLNESIDWVAFLLTSRRRSEKLGKASWQHFQREIARFVPSEFDTIVIPAACVQRQDQAVQVPPHKKQNMWHLPVEIKLQKFDWKNSHKTRTSGVTYGVPYTLRTQFGRYGLHNFTTKPSCPPYSVSRANPLNIVSKLCRFPPNSGGKRK